MNVREEAQFSRTRGMCRFLLCVYFGKNVLDLVLKRADTIL